MCGRHCIEAVDRTLRAIMKSSTVPFGGKFVLFSGDFRQILPVVPRVSQSLIVFMCFKSSPLYQCVNFLSLKENRRLQSIKSDQPSDKGVLDYPEFLLKVAEGKLERTTDLLINLLRAVNFVESPTDLIDSVFQNPSDKYDDVQ